MLTKQCLRALQFMESTVADAGRTPTLRSIAVALGSNNQSNAYRIMNQLEERGFVRRVRYASGKTMGYELLRPAPVQVFKFDDETKALMRVN